MFPALLGGLRLEFVNSNYVSAGCSVGGRGSEVSGCRWEQGGRGQRAGTRRDRLSRGHVCAWGGTEREEREKEKRESEKKTE